MRSRPAARGSRPAALGSRPAEMRSRSAAKIKVDALQKTDKNGMLAALFLAEKKRGSQNCLAR